MQTLGNISLGLAAFLYILPLQLILRDTAAMRKDGGVVWMTIPVLAPFWLLMTLALEMGVLRGGLDWVGWGRGWQFFAVLLSGLTLAVITFFSVIGKVEPPSQMPWAARPFSGWAVLVFPLVTLLFGLLTLNPDLGASVPRLAFRAPMAAVAGLSLLANLGLIAQGIAFLVGEQISRVERNMAESNERDRHFLARVESLDPAKDFPELLGFANRFENDEIRQVAITKALSHPEFIPALAKVLRSGWAEQGLIYLDACDVSAEHEKTLAEPVRAAIGILTGQAKGSVERTHTFFEDQFDWNTRIMLSVADKFRDQGVDYVSSIREYRRALDTERTRKVRLNARATLDSWLEKQKLTTTP